MNEVVESHQLPCVLWFSNKVVVEKIHQLKIVTIEIAFKINNKIHQAVFFYNMAALNKPSLFVHIMTIIEMLNENMKISIAKRP